MKKIVSIVVLCMMAQVAVARPPIYSEATVPPVPPVPPIASVTTVPLAARAGTVPMAARAGTATARNGSQGRAGMTGQQIMAAPRAGSMVASGGDMAAAGTERAAGVVSAQQIATGTVLSPNVSVVGKSSTKLDNDVTDSVTADLAIVPEEMISAEKKKDMREKERAACINNNIGVGNTFVWASRFSNVNNYSSMIEDVENPENNVCFVKVEMKSTDSKIEVDDIPVKYFEMGRVITCGSWADEETLRKRILDAKKSARTWGTVAGVVGGAAVGVGAMELFGNKLIGGSVEGQKALKGDELIRSQLAVLQKDNPSEYQRFMVNLRTLRDECSKDIWVNDTSDTEVKTICDTYRGLFSMAG